MHSVVTEAMPGVFDGAKDVGVSSYIVAHHEEGSFDIVSVEDVEDTRGDIGDWSVIESEIGRFASFLLNTPYRLREKETI